jgi:glycosyltransferase involved in cell wall biosynthesis
MAKIKLLHITSSLKMGGAEQVLYTLATQLDAKQFDQCVIYFHEGPYAAKLKELGIPLVCVRGFFFRYDPLFFVRLYRAIKKQNPDCVHTLLWIANFAGRLCAWAQRIPCVSVFHNHVGTDGRVRNMLDWLTLRFACTLVAVSDPVKQSAHTYLGCKREIQVIQNGIDLSKIEGLGKTRESLGMNDTHFIIGTVGRFEPVKRYDLLLACAAPLMNRYSHVRLCLIGLGSQEEALQAQARELGIADRVAFVIGQPAMDYYSLFDCFVQTTAQEGVSIALLEAMSFGLPCVVMHDTNKHPVIENGRDGIMVNAADYQGFQAALEQVITNKIMGERFGAAARDKVMNSFDASRMVRGYERVILSEIINKRVG